MEKSNRRAKGLTAADVQETLASRLYTRSLQITRLCLERAIRYAEVRDLVGRNVVALVKAPTGRGRPAVCDAQSTNGPITGPSLEPPGVVPCLGRG